MARVVPKIYDYQPDETLLDWSTAPDPPEDIECELEWDRENYWDKSFHNHVLTRTVRDAYFDYEGDFPNFAAPELLDEQGFRKFCYLASTFEFVCIDEPPANYLPFDFRNDPLGWAWKQYKLRESKKRWNATDTDSDSDIGAAVAALEEDELFYDEAGELVLSNDHVRLVHHAETELNGTRGTAWYLDPERQNHVTVFMPTISENTAISISIHNLRKLVYGSDPATHLDLVDWDEFPDHFAYSASTITSLLEFSDDLKGHIASYLPLLDVQRSLRLTCKDAFYNFQKPPPVADFDFVYFSVSNAVDTLWHGVAHTTIDVVTALKKGPWGGEGCQLVVNMRYVKFDRRQPIVPLFVFHESLYGHGTKPTRLSRMGQNYFGVVAAKHLDLVDTAVWPGWLDDAEVVENTAFVHTIRYYQNLKPREPRIDLESIGLRKADCVICGQCEQCGCLRANGGGPGGKNGGEWRIYYSPQWFSASNYFAYSAPRSAESKNVIVFGNTFRFRTRES